VNLKSHKVIFISNQNFILHGAEYNPRGDSSTNQLAGSSCDAPSCQVALLGHMALDLAKRNLLLAWEI
jgi:hypothetical protein